MKWAVTGAGGMLGTDVLEVLRAAGDDALGLSRADLDVTDPDGCRAALAGIDVVVNCAAWTDVDGAESNQAGAFAVNAVGAANVARASAAEGAVLVHVSTDYVFAGDATSPYRADAPLAPLNAYGRTKAAGEWAVRAHNPSSYVVRTAWLYGRHGSSFPTTMLRLAASRDTVDVVDDQRGQPTWTRDLAIALRALALSGDAYGVHHGTSSGETTWFGFAREVFLRSGLDPDRVRPVTSASFPRPAVRPAYSVLAPTGLALPEWQEGLAGFLGTLPA